MSMAKREFPIHMVVREGHAEVVQLPLQAGADPSQSRYTYNSWDKLLAIAEERVYGEVQALPPTKTRWCTPLSADSERSPSAWAG